MPPADDRPPVRALDRAPADAQGRMFAPSAARNGAELLPLLRRVFPERGEILEVGSGTGQHAAFFAARMPGLRWLPTDIDDATFDSIRAWCAAEQATNVAPPRVLDVADAHADVPACDGMLTVNVLHIAPMAAMTGLVRVAARALRGRSPLVVYGPFLFEDRPNAASNEDFDRRLRDMDANFGVRTAEDLARATRAAGLEVAETVPMPNNNTAFVILRR